MMRVSQPIVQTALDRHPLVPNCSGVANVRKPFIVQKPVRYWHGSYTRKFAEVISEIVIKTRQRCQLTMILCKFGSQINYFSHLMNDQLLYFMSEPQRQQDVDNFIH